MAPSVLEACDEFRIVREFEETAQKTWALLFGGAVFVNILPRDVNAPDPSSANPAKEKISGSQKAFSPGFLFSKAPENKGQVSVLPVAVFFFPLFISVIPRNHRE